MLHRQVPDRRSRGVGAPEQLDEGTVGRRRLGDRQAYFGHEQCQRRMTLPTGVRRAQEECLDGLVAEQAAGDLLHVIARRAHSDTPWRSNARRTEATARRCNAFTAAGDLPRAPAT